MDEAERPLERNELGAVDFAGRGRTPGGAGAENAIVRPGYATWSTTPSGLSGPRTTTPVSSWTSRRAARARLSPRCAAPLGIPHVPAPAPRVSRTSSTAGSGATR
jgi:hypothetical protein